MICSFRKDSFWDQNSSAPESKVDGGKVSLVSLVSAVSVVSMSSPASVVSLVSLMSPMSSFSFLPPTPPTRRPDVDDDIDSMFMFYF